MVSFEGEGPRSDRGCNIVENVSISLLPNVPALLSKD
jgi:hypothetical protein